MKITTRFETEGNPAFTIDCKDNRVCLNIGDGDHYYVASFDYKEAKKLASILYEAAGMLEVKTNKHKDDPCF